MRLKIFIGILGIFLLFKATPVHAVCAERGICAISCGAGFVTGDIDDCDPAKYSACCIRLENIEGACKGTCRSSASGGCDAATEKTDPDPDTSLWCQTVLGGNPGSCCIPKEGVETKFDCDVIKQNGNILLYPVCALRELAVMGSYVLNMIAIITGIGTFLMLIYGGFLYITAQDDTSQTEKARKTITWAVIGLVLAVSTFIIMRLVGSILNINIFGYQNKVYAQETTPYVQIIGKVYDSTDKIQLNQAQVYLYQKQTAKWVLWPGEDYNNQRNPQYVDENGEYLFLVPKGEYYVKVVSTGYYNKDSSKFEVVSNPVRVNVYMQKASPLWKIILGFGVGVFILVMGYILIRTLVLWSEKQRIKRSVLRKVEEMNRDVHPNLPEQNKSSQE